MGNLEPRLPDVLSSLRDSCVQIAGRCWQGLWTDLSFDISENPGVELSVNDTEGEEGETGLVVRVGVKCPVKCLYLESTNEKKKQVKKKGKGCLKRLGGRITR